VGEVTPKPEDCSTPEDDDCDGLAPTCKGSLAWAKRFGDAGDQHPTAVAVDTLGNVIVVGNFGGTVDFGGTSLTCAGASCVFVVKLNASGTHLWSKRFGDGGEIATGVAVDAAGEIVVVCNSAGTINFGGGDLVAQKAPGIVTHDVVVAKLDAEGNHIWSKDFGDAADQTVSGVALDATSNVVIVGGVAGSIDFGGGALTSAGLADVFVAKLSSSAGHVWSKRFGDASNQSAGSVALDSLGNVFLAGSFAGTLDFGGGDGALQAMAGQDDMFLVKLGASNVTAWSKGVGNGGHQVASTVATDPMGNVIVAGDFDGTASFGFGAPLVSAGGHDIFVAQLATSNTPQWDARYGDTSDQVATAVATDQAGGVLMAGYFAGSVNFGGGVLASLGGKDIFVTKLDSGGNHTWSKRFGDGSDQTASAVAVGPDGSGVVVGSFAGSADFGGGALTSAGGTDIFVAKFAP
jgi:hypothetical protein